MKITARITRYNLRSVHVTKNVLIRLIFFTSALCRAPNNANIAQTRHMCKPYQLFGMYVFGKYVFFIPFAI